MSPSRASLRLVSFSAHPGGYATEMAIESDPEQPEAEARETRDSTAPSSMEVKQGGRRRRDSGARRMSDERVQAVTARDCDPYAALAELAASGDQEATGQLLRLLTPRIYGVGRSLFGATHRDLDDAVQESLLAFFRALPNFEHRSTVLHFATRIAVRTCLAHRKRARRDEVRLGNDAESTEASANAPRVHIDQSAHHRREAVRALLGALPDVQAEALALRICLGLSLEQVAAATDTPQNTVRSRLRLARQALLRRVESDPALCALVEDAT